MAEKSGHVTAAHAKIDNGDSTGKVLGDLRPKPAIERETHALGAKLSSIEKMSREQAGGRPASV
jgi:hypothetical protein